MPGSPESDALAHKAMAEGPYEIRPGHTGADYFPNFLEDFVDPKKVCNANMCSSEEIWLISTGVRDQLGSTRGSEAAI